MAFLVTPLLIVQRTPKLKKLVFEKFFSTFETIVEMKSKVWSLLYCKSNQIHPYIIVV